MTTRKRVPTKAISCSQTVKIGVDGLGGVTVIVDIVVQRLRVTGTAFTRRERAGETRIFHVLPLIVDFHRLHAFRENVVLLELDFARDDQERTGSDHHHEALEANWKQKVTILGQGVAIELGDV